MSIQWLFQQTNALTTAKLSPCAHNAHCKDTVLNTVNLANKLSGLIMAAKCSHSMLQPAHQRWADVKKSPFSLFCFSWSVFIFSVMSTALVPASLRKKRKTTLETLVVSSLPLSFCWCIKLVFLLVSSHYYSPFNYYFSRQSIN